MSEDGLRILMLDAHGDTLAAQLKARGVNPIITSLTSAEVREGIHYATCQRGKELAENATTDLYDLVLIGNNMSAGFAYATLLPLEMRKRTLVVWNDPTPEDQRLYQGIGYEHFGQRINQQNLLLKMVDELEREGPHPFWSSASVDGRMYGEQESAEHRFDVGVGENGLPMICIRSRRQTADWVKVPSPVAILVQLFEYPDVLWLATAIWFGTARVPAVKYTPLVPLEAQDGTSLPPLPPVSKALITEARDDAERARTKNR